MHKSFEILLINIATVWLSNSAMRCYWRSLHYTKNSLSSPCTSQHKHEQKDKTKTLVKFPDHVFIDFDCSETTFLGDGLETVAVKFVSRIDML